MVSTTPSAWPASSLTNSLPSRKFTLSGSSTMSLASDSPSKNKANYNSGWGIEAALGTRDGGGTKPLAMAQLNRRA